MSAVSSATPPLAKVAFEQGRTALEDPRRDEAEPCFTRAATLYPRHSMEWFELGMLPKSRGKTDDARAAYEKAAADPRHISPHPGLVQLAVHENQWPRVTEYTEQVLRLDPENFPDAWMYHAVGSLARGSLDAAEKSARETMRLDTSNQFPRAEYLFALVLAAKGDAPGAKVRLAHYIEADPKAPGLAAIKRHLADLGDQIAAGCAPAWPDCRWRSRH